MDIDFAGFCLVAFVGFIVGGFAASMTVEHNIQKNQNERAIAVGLATFAKDRSVIYLNDDVKFILTGEE